MYDISLHIFMDIINVSYLYSSNPIVPPPSNHTRPQLLPNNVDNARTESLGTHTMSRISFQSSKVNGYRRRIHKSISTEHYWLQINQTQSSKFLCGYLFMK